MVLKVPVPCQLCYLRTGSQVVEWLVAYLKAALGAHDTLMRQPHPLAPPSRSQEVVRPLGCSNLVRKCLGAHLHLPRMHPQIATHVLPHNQSADAHACKVQACLLRNVEFPVM
jgi:hypothetical protein